MKRDIAERIAATSVEDFTVEKVRTVIAAFLSELARCPLCNGDQTFTFPRDVWIDTVDNYGRPLGGTGRYIKAGTVASCPLCGDDRDYPRVNGDPEHVAWHCELGESDRQCLSDKDADKSERREVHAKCGWRIMLPHASDAAEGGA